MAKAAIQNALWLDKFSDSLQDDLAKLMLPFDAPEGHVFIREGELVSSILLVESGILTRTKLPAGDGHTGEEPTELDTVSHQLFLLIV